MGFTEIEVESVESKVKDAPPSASDMTKGLVLFIITLVAYAFYCLGVKVVMKRFTLSVPELIFIRSLILIAPFYLVVKKFKQDHLAITAEDQSHLAKRVIYGFISDALLFVSITMISYSKGFCLFFTNTLMGPFIARAMLGEEIKKWDMIGIAFGACGMLMIVQPFGQQEVQAN